MHSRSSFFHAPLSLKSLIFARSKIFRATLTPIRNIHITFKFVSLHNLMKLIDMYTNLPLNPIQDWRGRKGLLLTSRFFSVTSGNVGLPPKSFWILFLTIFPHWFKISKPYLEAVLNYGSQPEPRLPLKKLVFLDKSL